MIKIFNSKIELNKFPDGTPLINCFTEQNIDELKQLVSGDKNNSLPICWNYENNEELIYLFFIVNHLRSVMQPNTKYILVMPYIPNARMDRVKCEKDVFTLKYFCNFINSLHFDKVYVLDAHSNVSLALLNNVTEISPIHYIKNAISNVDPDMLFFPDEGSSKRYSDIIKNGNFKQDFELAFGIKKRDWNSGKILGLDINNAENVRGRNILIIDDICSKGGTFYHSAKKLKELGANSISLYVTHCENSVLAGEMINSGLIDNIYTTDSIFTAQHEKINIIGHTDSIIFFQ